ncbi:MAG: FAD-dependent monooxygenase [Actinomycetota bacterium]
MYDAIIVGARCAGSPLGMLLARSEHRVLVVDRASFPSDTMSTHFVQSPGMMRLARWGLMDRLFASNCPPITHARFDLGNDNVVEFEIPLDGALRGLAAPRRHVLDKILVDAAVEAGAELAEGVSIDSLLYEDDRVAGVSGHTNDGDFEARARIVVGADGRHSVVARETGAGFVRNDGDSSAGYYTYFGGVSTGVVETYLQEDLFGIVFPTNDELAVVGLAWRHERFKDVKRDIEGNFFAALDRMGDLGPRVRAGERTERFVGTADVPNYLRKVWGPGWALVGDAGYHKDPAPADGITDAFRAAEYLAEAFDEIANGADEDAALTRYEQRHAETALPLLDAAVNVASFDNTPEQRFEAFIEIRLHDAHEVQELGTREPMTNGA